MMYSNSYRFLSGLFVTFLSILLITGISTQAIAQSDQVSEEDEVKLNDQAAELLKQIQENIEAAERYENMLGKASEEDHLVLEKQLAARQSQAIDRIHKLADLLVDNEQSKSLSGFRDQLAEKCRRVALHLQSYGAALRNDIDALRAKRSSVSIDERSDLEDWIVTLTRRLDASYQYSLTNLEKMQKLGLNTEEFINELKKSISSRADELSGRLDLSLERIESLKERIEEAPDNSEFPVLLAAVQKSHESNIKSLEKTLDMMDALELPTAEYRTQLVKATSEIATALVDWSVATNLAKRGYNSAKTWLAESGPDLLAKIVLFLIILLVVYVLAVVLRKLIARILERSGEGVSVLLRTMILKAVFNLVMLFGFLVALSQMGISLGPLLAGLGVAGFIVGFALQDSLSNFAAGLMILMYKPYDVGDLVDIGGVFGKVDQMTLVSTSILTIDNQKILVPNRKIWGDVIKNVTAQDIRRVDMVFGISYSDDIPKAEEVLAAILKDDPRILEDPEPMVHLHTLGESSVDFVVRPWVKSQDYWDIYWHVTREVKMRFDAESINIPFPQRDVHIYNEQVSGDGSPARNPSDKDASVRNISGQDDSEKG